MFSRPTKAKRSEVASSKFERAPRAEFSPGTKKFFCKNVFHTKATPLWDRTITGQRRGDVIRMGRQHVRGDVLRVTQRKTGATLALPIHPELAAVLATVPATQMTFLMTLKGTPFTDHAFSDWFGKACDKAGLGSQCTFHGLRKAACRRLAEAGC